MPNNTPTGAMTLLRPTIKGQKVEVRGGPIPGIPCPFPKIEYPSHLLAYEITQPIKTNHPGLLLRQQHSTYGMCISLNKLSFTLPWLTFEFFPVWSQGPSLGSPSQELAWNLGHDHPLAPHSPATKGGMRNSREREMWSMGNYSRS